MRRACHLYRAGLGTYRHDPSGGVDRRPALRGAVLSRLARGRHRVGSWHSPLIAGAGLLLAVAALQKYTTATTVIVALGVLFVLHRSRAWMIMGWTALLTAVLFGIHSRITMNGNGS